MANLTQKQQEKPLELIRIDRGLAANAAGISQTFQGGAMLVHQILIYCYVKQVNNLFDLKEITIPEFCSFWKTPQRELYRQHPDIERMRLKPENYTIKGYQFRNILEYTLYKMLNSGIVVATTKYYQEEITHKFKSFLLLDELEVTHKRKNPKHAVRYGLRVNPLVTNNLFNQFFKIDIDGYVAIARGNGAEVRMRLYLFLCNAMTYNAGRSVNEYLEFTVDKWIEIMIDGTSGSEDVLEMEPKKKKQWVKRKFTSVQEKASVKFEFEFLSFGRNTEEYLLRVTFPDESILKFRNTKLSRFQTSVHNALLELYKDIFILSKGSDGQELLELMLKNKWSKFMAGFNSWLETKDIDNNVEMRKAIAVCNAYSDIFKITITKDEGKEYLLSPETFIEQFCTV